MANPPNRPRCPLPHYAKGAYSESMYRPVHNTHIHKCTHNVSETKQGVWGLWWGHTTQSARHCRPNEIPLVCVVKDRGYEYKQYKSFILHRAMQNRSFWRVH